MDKFCEICGAKLDASSDTVYCGKCSASVRKQNRLVSNKKKNFKSTGKMGKTSICAKCGKDYVASKNRQRKCENCAKEAAVNKEKRLYRFCLWCNTYFKSSYNSRYCSPECRKESWNKMTRERYLKIKKLKTPIKKIPSEKITFILQNESAEMARKKYGTNSAMIVRAKELLIADMENEL